MFGLKHSIDLFVWIVQSDIGLHPPTISIIDLKSHIHILSLDLKQ